MHRITRFLTARSTSWIVLVVAFLASAAVFALGSGSDSTTGPGSGLPDSAESARVSAAQQSLPGADTSSGLFVFHRDSGVELDQDDLAAVDRASQALATFALDGFVPPATVADDGTTAIVVIPLSVESDVDLAAERATELREAANADLPDGLTALLTGAEGFAVDIAGVFAGADFTLLLTTVIVVAVLLIVTYRSPWLWLVPLVVIGVADGLAGIVATRVAALAGIELDASTTGILSVLVFGAGTNYALLLIARYKDELRINEDRRVAMSSALRGAGPAVIASGSTVVLSLLTLLFAQLTGNRALGIACAVGVVIAMLFALVVLPAALVMFGRGLFWPYAPRFGSPNPSEKGVWARLGRAVSRKPLVVAVVGIAVLGGLSVGATQVQTGLSQTEAFRSEPEAVRGQNLIAESFSAGSGSPTVVIVDAAYAEEARNLAESVDGVDSATVGESDGTITQVSVVLSAAAETDRCAAWRGPRPRRRERARRRSRRAGVGCRDGDHRRPEPGDAADPGARVPRARDPAAVFARARAPPRNRGGVVLRLTRA
jgi:RND superfamily putative drug exporter